MDLERGQIKLRSFPWAEARLSHAAAVAAANWDRPQVYVAEIKGMWPQEILDAHREQQLKQQVLTAFNREVEVVPEPRVVVETRGQAPPSQASVTARGFKPPTRRATGAGTSTPLQNNFVTSERLRGAGNYGWAAQRLSRATALAAVHWQNPRAYRAELHGRRDPEDVREEELQIQVLGKIGGESLEESLREKSCRQKQSAQQFLESHQRKQQSEAPEGATPV
eukprot:symbB.v1.2.019551.t1/scaffold1601.1/size109688/4